MSLKEIQSYVSLLVDKVADNVTIVAAKDIKQDYMLHISPENMARRKYIPIIGRRQDPSEDRSVPRVTVAPTLLGCIIGYTKLFTDAINYYPDTDIGQGVYIHAIEFEHALKPTSKLVYDAKYSDEHWLVTCSDATKEYKGSTIGKMFTRQVIYTTRAGKPCIGSYVLNVEVTKPEGIAFSKNIWLDKGYWAINIATDISLAWDKDKAITATPLSKEDYMKQKEESVALLSHTDQPPVFSKW